MSVISAEEMHDLIYNGAQIFVMLIQTPSETSPDQPPELLDMDIGTEEEAAKLEKMLDSELPEWIEFWKKWAHLFKDPTGVLSKNKHLFFI